ncbi:MAG: hypothetical protein MAG795_00053 [Candidatus Woesearchaeota archaeon]|nr:hypothetical protein [Candidatus Woesearchaeota archaeon]
MKHNEDTIEQAAIEILKDLGYKYGPDISPGGKNPLRQTWGDVILDSKLKSALQNINPNLPKEAYEESLYHIYPIASGRLCLV